MRLSNRERRLQLKTSVRTTVPEPLGSAVGMAKKKPAGFRTAMIMMIKMITAPKLVRDHSMVIVVQIREKSRFLTVKKA